METLTQARTRLCAVCVLKTDRKCNGRLKPITSDGKDCPYFEEEK